MKINNLIEVNKFCANHAIDISFIYSLLKNGMIEITTIDHTHYFNAEQLQQLDKYILFYYELNIHPEDIDSIRHMCLNVKTFYNEFMSLSSMISYSEHLKYMN